jgi:glycosyltransferase involved in cell wall biosynthesis
VADLSRLKSLGIVDNAALFPHGIAESSVGMERAPAASGGGSEITIASYGFFLPHKGLLELVEAVALLRRRGLRIRLKMVNAEYPVGESAALVERTKRRVLELDLTDSVDVCTDFLSDEESLRRLSDADLLVFPYQQTGESASGAVRYGIATGVPVAVTPLPIFEDVASAVSILPGFAPTDIADGIGDLLEKLSVDAAARDRLARAAAAWREAHSYSKLGRRLQGMLTALLRRRRAQVEVAVSSPADAG